MVVLPEKLQKKLLERKKNNAIRTLPSKSIPFDFSSNDYLGFAKNQEVFHNALELLKEHDLILNGATGSRLLSGNHTLYTQLEKSLGTFHEVDAALVFNSGYDANIGFFSAVPQRGDVVIYDEFIHASIRDGIRLGNAKSYKFKHNDLDDLKSKISLSYPADNRGQNTEVYIVTESVFSMDGDSPNLKDLANFCVSNNYHLVVDEAHSVGVYGNKGEGLVQELGLQDQVFARIVTFGKALGCHGAAILGSEKLREYLINYARSFVYTTGLSPHTVATILSAYDHLQTTQGLKAQQGLKENIEFFKRKLEYLKLKSKFIPSNSAIQCCRIQGNENVNKTAKTLQAKGFDVRPILSPTVPTGEERLRICLHTYNSEKQIEEALKLLQTIV